MELELGAIGINNMSDQAGDLEGSLREHILECKRIKGKICNSAVPSGKKEKLKYRLKVLINQVIPKKEEELRSTRLPF